jgi:hypothetical protein
MTGELNLKNLLTSMSPELMDGEYVFCSFQNAQYGDYTVLEPIVTCLEQEGLTLVIPKSNADEHKVDYEFTYRRITLKVHSSLEAVGLTAAFSKKLTEHGISANVIAGFFHDHIFIRSDHAKKALEALKELTEPE